MFETDQRPPVESATEIRITGINTDKTRKMIGSETKYLVYFELSGAPSQGWRTVFEREWKAFNAGQPLSLQETSIDRAFLVMHCPLQEVARHLPDLKKAVAATNTAFREYARRQAVELKDREDVWKDERKAVEEVAKLLNFN